MIDFPSLARLGTETMAEIHKLINPLITRTSDAAKLLKKISKLLLEDKTESVKEFYKNNASEVQSLI